MTDPREARIESIYNEFTNRCVDVGLVEAKHEIAVALCRAEESIDELKSALAAATTAREAAEQERDHEQKWAASLGEELHRVKQRTAEAELQCDMRESTLHMTVARLGGTVEGRPTERVNFLQRVDELRAIEQWGAALAEAMEGLRAWLEGEKAAAERTVRLATARSVGDTESTYWAASGLQSAYRATLNRIARLELDRLASAKETK
jgi:chromosome segregation ATPase